MHAPTATSRPLPKRTRSTAGLEEIDAWIGQISSSSSSNSGVVSVTQSSAQHPPQSQHEISSRKRHHSLPTSSLSGTLYRSPLTSNSRGQHTTASKQTTAASVGTVFDDASHPRAFQSTPGLRPDLPVFAAQPQQRQQRGFSTSSSRRLSNQHSPSLFEPHTDAFSATPRTSNAVALAATLQPPEMSPREDFLVRAFVSDAMKLETDDLHGFSPSPLNLSDLDHGGDNSYMAPSPTTEAQTPTNFTGNNQQQQSNSQGHQKWSREEDEKLRDTVTRFGGKSWKLIAETLGNGRTDVQCLHRWNKVLKPGLVKGPWTPEEDRVLLSLIARYGVGQIRWCDVALHLPGRIGKQCRERWCNHLDSSIRKGQWTPEEDDTVFRLQQQMGNKWSEIAKKLPGRTENAVKNRFNSAARRKWLVSQALAGSSTNQTPLVTPRPGVHATSFDFEHASNQDMVSPGRVASRPAVKTPSRTGRAFPTGTPMGSTRTGPHLLSSGLLAGPPRPPQPQKKTEKTQQTFLPPPPTFRGPSYASPQPLTPSFETTDSGEMNHTSTVSATTPGLFPFVDDYQQPSPLPFGSPSQLQIAYSSTSSGSTVSLSDARPSFSFPNHCVFHQQHDTPSSTSSPALFRTQFLQSATNSPSLASLTALLSSPQPKLQDPEEDPFAQQHRDSREMLDDALEIKQEHVDEGQGDQDHSDNNGSNQEHDAATTPLVSKRTSFMALEASKQRLSEPEVDSCDADDEDEDGDALRSIDIPDSDVDGEHGGAGSSPVMDDQNMSTFLDSVALELDDMI